MSDCGLCGKPNGFVENGWIALVPVDLEADENGHGKDFCGVICQDCTAGAVIAWAKECRRKAQDPKGGGTPTGSPAGAGTAFVELLANVA